MVLIQAEYFLHFAQNFLEDISFLVIFECLCRTFIPTENRRNSSLHFQIFPATELLLLLLLLFPLGENVTHTPYCIQSQQIRLGVLGSLWPKAIDS